MSRPVRATKTLVRPGRKNGGTTIAFSLSRRATVRFTVVRVYPSCKRVGSFTVRAHAGANRVRFRGRLGRRVLPEGTYRLLVRVRGQAVASVPIVVARGRVTAKDLRRARRANSCSAAEAQTIAAAAGAAPTDDSSSESLGASVIEPVVGAAKGVARAAIEVAKTGRSLPGRVRDAADEKPFADPVVVTIVGLMLLAISLLGMLVLLDAMRTGRLRDRYRWWS